MRWLDLEPGALLTRRGDEKYIYLLIVKRGYGATTLVSWMTLSTGEVSPLEALMHPESDADYGYDVVWHP